jgi:transposase-like protein
MEDNTQAIKSLQDAIKHYSDELVCINQVARMRWSSGKAECPACGGTDHYWLNTQRRWKCKECWKQFSVKVGTVFEESPLSLTKWLPALWMLVNCKNGISSYELARALSVSQKAAWFMLHRLRTALHEDDLPKMGGTEGGPVEVDEAYVGGHPKNRHLGKRDPGHGKKYLLDEDGDRAGLNPDYVPHVCGRATHKTPVFGMLDREARKVRAHVIPEVKREPLMDAILANVEKGSTVYSDGLGDYRPLRNMEFVHETVNHVNEYVRGQVHTQGIENFWSLLKRSLKGTYVAVEPFHLDKYVGEQVFRYNTRGSRRQKVSDFERFSLALTKIAGKRLTFAEVTGKVGEKPAEF